MNIHTEDTKYCVFVGYCILFGKNGSRDREVFLKIRKKKIRKITPLIINENDFILTV